MIVRNFWFRVGQYLHENRARLIKALLIAAAAMLVLAAVYYAVERIQKWSYEKGIATGESLYQKQKAEAQAAQSLADDLKLQIAVLDAEVTALRKRSDAAAAAYRNAQTKTVTLKEEYETIRYKPVPVDDASVASACSELAGLGYKCD